MPNDYIDPATTALDTPVQVVAYALDSVHRMINAWDTLWMFDDADDHDAWDDALGVCVTVNVDVLETIAIDLKAILDRIN